MTLYRLSGERAGHFICASAACLQVWHPLTAHRRRAHRPARPSLDTVKRPDGSSQVAYKGTPLYTFAQDTSPDDAKGQGLKDVGTWNAVTVAGPATSRRTGHRPRRLNPRRNPPAAATTTERCARGAGAL